MNRINQNDINEAIKSGIDYLARNQREDGSFPGFVSASKQFNDARENQSVFPACLILSSLNSLSPSKDIKRVKSGAAKFLLSQKSEFWSWNYWKRNSVESKTEPYPDDLDDTCCAMAALIGHNPKLVSVKAVAKAVNLLAYCESEEGGPYYTWITPPEAGKGWKDFDLAVNSNIAFFLSLQGVSLPSLVALVEKAITSEKYESAYYHSPYAVAHFISRWYNGKKKDKIISYLLNHRLKNYSWGNPLDTALAVSALLNLGCKKENVEESIASILKNRIDGGWKAYPFIIEKIKKKKKYYSGGAEMTTAFCFEALAKFSFRTKPATGGQKETNKQADEAHRKLTLSVEKRFSRFDSVAKETFSIVRKKILKGDGANRITLLPYYFCESTGRKKQIDEKIILDLCAAGFYGWTAYTVYDDFFDDEGDPKFLSLANVCLRELISIYGDIFSRDKKFQELFKNTMDRIDAANFWETDKCRAKVSGLQLIIPENLPDYGDMKRLADRSIGFALGPAAVLYLLTGRTESADMKNLIGFFENYIIARQLNDDAHDWETDLKGGRLSPAVTRVLSKFLRRRKKESVKALNLKKDIGELREIFWREVIQEICGKAVSCAEKARRHLKGLSAMKDKTVFESMLASVENSAQKALAEQKEAVEFLGEYE